tara:strand:+ start:1073 stop:1585 length:513 start_codon:yes stop_codon:yes gene_type:complete
MYSKIAGPISFGFMTGLQTLYVVFFIFQLFNDNNVSSRALNIKIPKTRFSVEDDIHVPLFWVILPGLVMQLISSIYVTVMTTTLQEKYGTVKLTRDNQWNYNMFKWMFIVATFSLMILTYSYCNDFTSGVPLSGSYRSFILIIFLSSIVFPIINIINSHKLSKTIFSITD